MFLIIFWAIIFSISGAVTTILLGDRNLISGNLLDPVKFFQIIFNWKFILAVFLSFIARYSFMIINNIILNIPRLADNSTTITTFITFIGVIFIIFGNYFFLDEKMNLQQGIGATLILIGVWVIFK
jgi:drug/metabolite transporter (DMT)-like permease